MRHSAKTAAEIGDHAKAFLDSLFDRPEENDVSCRYSLDPGNAKAELLLRSCADLSFNLLSVEVYSLGGILIEQVSATVD